MKKALGDKIKSVTIEEMMMYITLTKMQPDRDNVVFVEAKRLTPNSLLDKTSLKVVQS